jgi:hypothetical protein
MKIFLAGSGWEKTCWANDNFYNFNRLESFAYISKFEETILKKYKNFLLDSGAFTYLNNANDNKINWDDYIDKYANFINKHDIKYFFELDIDNIVGLKEVERLRHKLEKKTKKKSIPVWHKNRGLDYWKKMVSEYKYVAIGGIVTNEIKRKEYIFFNSLIKIAENNNCNVHGLGFTNLKGLKKYKFYSVDSTSWLSGNRFGAVYWFNGITMKKQNKKQGQRVLTNKTAKHNFKEWVKFNNYAEINL